MRKTHCLFLICITLLGCSDSPPFNNANDAAKYFVSAMAKQNLEMLDKINASSSISWPSAYILKNYSHRFIGYKPNEFTYRTSPSRSGVCTYISSDDYAVNLDAEFSLQGKGYFLTDMNCSPIIVGKYTSLGDCMEITELSAGKFHVNIWYCESKKGNGVITEAKGNTLTHHSEAAAISIKYEHDVITATYKGIGDKNGNEASGEDRVFNRY